jgi:hypothetical protein
MLRMQDMAFQGFKLKKNSFPPDPVAFSHSYPSLIYYLTERSLFKKCPPPTRENA